MQAAVEQVKTELSCTFLELDWDDSQQFDIPDDDLVKCVQFVHAAISKGHSVLVHCAQVSIIYCVAIIYLLCTRQSSLSLWDKQHCFLPPSHVTTVRLCTFVNM